MHPVPFACAAILAISAAAQDGRTEPKPGEIRENVRDGARYAWIPTGTFAMGCSAGDAECRGDQPPHAARIGHGFWMGQTEITVGAYKKFIAVSLSRMPPESQWNPGWQDETRPIVNLTWDEAAAYCSAAGGRLPSEEEWEYAARAGEKAARYGAVGAIAWYSENSGRKGPLAVRQKQANAWGLFDMLGNVWEWTTGLFPLTGRDDGPNLPATPPEPFWAIRGGAWSDAARLIRVSVRGRAPTSHRSNSIGARCVLDSL
jgi:formylglycine-generating enzyme required for sulfatase activity